jgi:hypothetical protein
LGGSEVGIGNPVAIIAMMAGTRGWLLGDGGDLGVAGEKKSNGDVIGVTAISITSV